LNKTKLKINIEEDLFIHHREIKRLRQKAAQDYKVRMQRTRPFTLDKN